ncbi:UDP-N-acetylmuramyl pentapeptide phosphotransferase/UDP-N-acetylglucosamine-1-phosphate transferase [Algoriphagus locisalis]|uniref:UDP-N-acetylmuramyl pentapeptide phosphotransferase/UDP-N-acetylglucosamine-1-phosphate transferase n=1 Tax=Algoriphagus locisalis TaxID=305507 RepID=A0A1I6Y5U7_9BACT|nr:MraY family glycosyltransferase [Algoriphagus locisalis]SFT45860.1 UDP-N-acetylmuramyl pentapeptide phosphotransferase/UDP-N-acetylglucosamine-1-phosphate transferase [Algoriphagus locisalis]
MFFILAALTAFTVGFLVTPILIKFLRKMKLGDTPGGRKIHKSFIPSMGGISFVAAVTVALAIWGWQYPLPDIRYLLGAICLMFFVGLRDDLVEMKATHKILGQLIAVVLVIGASDIRIKDFHGFLGLGELNLYVSYAFSAFTLLALTNAFNLIDGLDGLASTMAAIVFSCLGVWFLYQGLESYALISFTFLGAILAFLVYNWHPAKIFMGDTGSLTLGFTMGALVMAFMEVNQALPIGNVWKFEPSFSAGVALLMFPLYDMGRVFTRRISQGKGPMTPDKSHVHHFLMRMGFTHDKVTLILASLQISIIVLVFVFKDFSDNIVLPLIVGVAIILGMRLDAITVKYVKKKVAVQPRVLEIRELKKTQSKKVKLKNKSFQSSEINLN